MLNHLQQKYAQKYIRKIRMHKPLLALFWDLLSYKILHLHVKNCSKIELQLFQIGELRVDLGLLRFHLSGMATTPLTTPVKYQEENIPPDSPADMQSELMSTNQEKVVYQTYPLRVLQGASLVHIVVNPLYTSILTFFAFIFANKYLVSLID